MAAPEHPVLSIVVVIVSDTITPRAKVSHLRSCLDALAHQTNPPPMEIIVPYHEDVDGIQDLERTYPDVTFMRATGVSIASRKGGGREHHDVLRACGLRAARGEIIALLEDHARPDANWSANVVAAHRQNCAAVGGAIENGIDRPLNWAVYYCDFGKYQNPLPPGESSYASDANTSYKRQALEMVRPTWQASFREVVVNGALIARGEKVILRPEVVIYQNRRDLDFVFALRERFSWGRSYAASRGALLERSEAACLFDPFPGPAYRPAAQDGPDRMEPTRPLHKVRRCFADYCRSSDQLEPWRKRRLCCCAPASQLRGRP